MYSDSNTTNSNIGTGEDDPDTSKRDIMNQGRRWIEAAGGVVEDEGDNAGVEISPLISYVSCLYK
jgi:UDP-N-acetylglucosamine/UDP-N-acetylgalactosamine diphosphorylase